jgi:anaerobic selenocysteine-containing dehydrogenase
MTRRVPSLAHWGAFTAQVEDGKVVGVEPSGRDPAPSPILASIPAMVHSPLRIARPAVREGWLKSRDPARNPLLTASGRIEIASAELAAAGREAIRVNPAEAAARGIGAGDPDVLTPDVGTSSLGEGTSAQTAQVQVERREGPLPPSRPAPPDFGPA